MGKYKISVQSVEKILKAIGREAPEYLQIIYEKSAPAVDYIKKHPKGTAISAVSVILAADNLRLRYQQKKDKGLKVLMTKALQKQDAEIQVLKSEAKKAYTLGAINEQLCKAVIDLQKGGDGSEEKQSVKERATDK